MEPMKPMKPMQPMEPMAPMSGGEAWWPRGLGQPASSGAQDGTRYAFFPDARRLLIERDSRVSTYDSGEHRIGGVSQSGQGSPPTFTGQNGPVRLDELKRLD